MPPQNDRNTAITVGTRFIAFFLELRLMAQGDAPTHSVDGKSDDLIYL
jgi:hypothetical protein